MDTLFVFLLTALTMSMVLTYYLGKACLKRQKEVTQVGEVLDQLLDDLKTYKREKSQQRLAENLTTVSESTKGVAATSQASSTGEKLLDKNSDSRTKNSEI